MGCREADYVVAAVRYLRTQRLADSLILYDVSMRAVAILRAEAELGVHPTANILECPYGNMCQTAYNRFASMHVSDFPMANLLVFWGGVQNGFWAFGLNAEHYATQIHTPILLLWGTADLRVTRAETDTIFVHLAGLKARNDFPAVGHEPYWKHYSADWEQQTRGFLSR